MTSTTTTGFGGHGAATSAMQVRALQVRVPAFAFQPRYKGGVRLIADGGTALAPPGPPLTD